MPMAATVSVPYMETNFNAKTLDKFLASTSIPEGNPIVNSFFYQFSNLI